MKAKNATAAMAALLITLFIYSMAITAVWRDEHKRAEAWKQETIDIAKKCIVTPNTK